MANFSTLIAEIEAYIKTNGEQEITGQILQNVLKDIVDTLGNGAVFKGIATTDGTPGTPDNNVYYFAALAGTYTNYGGAVLDGNTLHILGYNGSWTDVDTGVPSATAAATFAKIDGYYASLTAGAAENLVGRGSVPASFLRRTTGGTADVGTGTAKIAKLMGNSIVWNQLADILTTHDGSGITITTGHDGYIKINGTASATFSLSVLTGLTQLKGHTILYGSLKELPLGASWSGSYNPDRRGLMRAELSSSFDGNLSLTIIAGTVFDNFEAYYRCVDLTKMFGAGKEPTTPAEFEALFSLPYYAYEPGKVLPFAAQKLVTTGFNQWDEESLGGKGYSTSTGELVNSANRIANENPIRIFGGMEYYAKFSGTSTLYLFYYDADMNFISYTFKNGSGTFTPPANAVFLNFMTYNDYGEVYNNNICINLSWSGYRNGEYEPYELHELTVDPANWEDANGDKIFPYGGMHGAGTARDFATPDTDGFIRKGTRVFGRVDLGSLGWTYSSTYAVFRTINGVPGMKNIGQIICEKYLAHNVAADQVGEKEISSMPSFVTGGVMVKDSTYGTDSDAFKTAMSGVYLYFELETPVETELAEPVAASYYANDFGTEEWQPANTDEPYTAPCELAIAYAMNAVDTLRRLPENYISTGSFENFCTELATKLGAALNKSITIAATYDAENEEYDYAITIEDIEEG